MAMAADMMRQNPDMVRHAAEAMSSMSDAQLAAHLASAGAAAGIPGGATPAMARAAAALMKDMTPDDVGQMSTKESVAHEGVGAIPKVATPSAIDPQVAAEAFRNDPGAMKAAAKMLEGMSPEDLEAMAAMPGARPGMKIDPEQMKMAAKMMEHMTADDWEKMTTLAQSMQGGMGASTSTVGPSAEGVLGAAPRFDPGRSIPPDMMENMRKSMTDPAMLRSMQSMLTGMDPQALASMLQGSGMNVAPEHVQKMVEQMGGVSDKHLQWIASTMRVINVVVDAYLQAKAWAMGNGALSLAILVLLIALLLRWLGWI